MGQDLNLAQKIEFRFVGCVFCIFFPSFPEFLNSKSQMKLEQLCYRELACAN